MSEYARRHLVCSSWHRCPEGWHQWSGNVSGYTTRPFCDLPVGHAGDHAAGISSIEPMLPTTVYTVHPDGTKTESQEMVPAVQVMHWPNKTGVPEWLILTTIAGLDAVRNRVYERDQTECEHLDISLEPIRAFLDAWPNTRYPEVDD